MIELTKTGIEGLDSILNGGIVSNSTTLVIGTPGAGKSILGLQFIYNGVEQFDERGIFLSFEENAADLRAAAESIGFDRWAEFEEAKDIKVYDKQRLLQQNDFSETLDVLLEDIDQGEYDRLVLDSLAMFELFFEDESEQRTYLLKFTDILKQNGLTSLLTNEQAAVFPDTDIGLENFLTDGNIYLIQTPTESGVNRYVWVAKMRKQNIETDIYPMEITQGGIEVHDSASAFSMMNDSTSPI
ncbi:RAD55 family ATPase [Halorhabdus rudnickae]|uniref:RAD55 family ATPase n=1 Tax=Halorhabdus rudnickae TaxID=1775544 RepID=UPI0010836E75|nr:ATPase domain-containing protein [Halorhabdus rudnickae]